MLSCGAGAGKPGRVRVHRPCLHWGSSHLETERVSLAWVVWNNCTLLPRAVDFPASSSEFPFPVPVSAGLSERGMLLLTNMRSPLQSARHGPGRLSFKIVTSLPERNVISSVSPLCYCCFISSSTSGSLPSFSCMLPTPLQQSFVWQSANSQRCFLSQLPQSQWRSRT